MRAYGLSCEIRSRAGREARRDLYPKSIVLSALAYSAGVPWTRAMSQGAAHAEEAGLHFTYVSSIERGQRNVSLQNILRLAAALSVDPAVLVSGLRPDVPDRPATRRP